MPSRAPIVSRPDADLAAAESPANVSQFFREAPSGLVEALPPGVSVTLELTHGDWRRCWALSRDEDGKGHIGPAGSVTPDCRLACSATDFLDLVTGRLDPRRGFMEGRLDVEGDVGLILQLHRCIVT